MSSIQRITAVAIVLSGLLLGGAAPVRADGHHCRERIDKAEWRLRRAIDKHGEDSPQADLRRHQLHEIREDCRHYENERREHERHEEHEHMEHEMHEH